MGRVQRWVLRGEKRSLKTQERVGKGDEGRVVVKSAPKAALEVVQAQLAFQLLVVAFDTPSQLCEADECACRGVLGKVRQVELGRLGLTAGPLGEQPLRLSHAPACTLMRESDAHGEEARGLLALRAIAPGDRPPCRARLRLNSLQDAHRLDFVGRTEPRCEKRSIVNARIGPS